MAEDEDDTEGITGRSLADLPLEQLNALRSSARYRLACERARENFGEFLKLHMLDPDDPDPDRSLYEMTPQAHLLTELVHRMVRRELKRGAVSIGPQYGKTQILSRALPAWIMGRNPMAQQIMGTFNAERARENGDDVRAIITSPFYTDVFPGFALRRGNTAKHHMVTKQGGKASFIGVGGSGTGKRADYFVIDDPYRNEQDAESDTYREKVWKWYNKVVFTRLNGNSIVFILHTRWHDDDLLGRLVDPDHPERNGKYAGLARRWYYLNLPAVIHDSALASALNLKLEVPTDPDVVDQFGPKPVATLWEAQKPLTLLAEARAQDVRTFDALYMGKPSPDDGAFFKADTLVEYDLRDLPPKSELAIYGASDHALSEKKAAAFTCLGCVGIDAQDNIWVLPDVFSEQVETDVTVEELIRQFKAHRPLTWWMESELISKSFGPFLRKRMREERVYVHIEAKTPSTDKKLRARAIQGRMSMRKVMFPRFAPWWPAARAQVLRFPYAPKKDFVDWLAWIGNGLNSQVRGHLPANDDNAPKVGTLRWLKQESNAREQQDVLAKARAGR